MGIVRTPAGSNRWATMSGITSFEKALYSTMISFIDFILFIQEMFLHSPPILPIQTNAGAHLSQGPVTAYWQPRI